MGVRILVASADCADAPGKACLFCSTTDTAFGPLFDSWEEAEGFCEWWRGLAGARDLRRLSDDELELAVAEYRDRMPQALDR